MGEEFYAIIKLVSGEEILTSVCIDESNDEPVVIIHNPVVMKMINSTHGSFIKVRPWICLLYTSPSPRDRTRSRMPSSA